MNSNLNSSTQADDLLEDRPNLQCTANTVNIMQLSRVRDSEGRNEESEPFQENADEPGLETVLNQKLRKKSHLVIYTTTFIMSIGFSIVLTGVWPYLTELDPSASKQFLGWVIAINPLGQMIASPLLGWLGSKKGSNRFSFMVTIVMFVSGNILYAVLPLFKLSAKYIMLLSRFMVGVSTANIAVCRSYISSSTKVRERTTALSITAAAQSLGYILGPCLQTALAYAYPLSHNQNFSSEANVTDFVNETLIGSRVTENDLGVFNMYSLAGWFTAFLGFLNFFLLLPCVYKEFYIAESEERNRAKLPHNAILQERKTNYVAISVVLFSYSTILLIFVLLETLIVPLCLDMYAWEAEFAVKAVGIGLTVAGCITFCMFILGGRLAKLFNDRKVFIVLGLIPLIVSMLVFFPISGDYPKIKYCSVEGFESAFNSTILSPTNSSEAFVRARRSVSVGSSDRCEELGCPASQEWCFYTPSIHVTQLICASVLTTIGYPVGVSLSGAIFSKILKAKEQGLWMGILTSTGSLSRSIGPIIVSYIYTIKGPLWTFVILFILLSIVFILNIVFYKRMAPILKDRSFENSS